jgi:alkylresorcinol/alkylpyrone synthase
MSKIYSPHGPDAISAVLADPGFASDHAPVPRLAALATSVPPYVLDQDAIRAAALEYGIFGDMLRVNSPMWRVFDNAGIDTRRSVAPIEWHAAHGHGWAERARVYLDGALQLLENAARDCLARAGRRFEEIDAVVTVGTTGIATPSLEAHLLNRLPLRSDIIRLPIFGLGCAGGVLGLARAADLVRADPRRRVLLLVVELCTLTFRPQDPSVNNLVATALFGDGAAAVLIEAEGDGPRIGAAGQHTWRGTLDIMGWRVEDDGFGVLFARDIPTLVRDDLPPALDQFLAANGLARADIDVLVSHPGGTKVLAALEESLSLAPGALDPARAVLREYGNMSAPTVLFVLERMLKPGARRYLLTALGPGFTAAFLVLDGA